MALWTWWRGDTLIELPHLSKFGVEAYHDLDAIQSVTSLDQAEIRDRLTVRHRCYVASIGGEPVAYGWVATLSAEIGELSLRFNVPDGDRYLWDFVTLPDWRGRGIYPRLLQSILSAESSEAARFWIIHAPENGASSSGIRKAGFREVSKLSFLRGKGVGGQSGIDRDRAAIGASLLGIPLVDAENGDSPLVPCWRCVTGAYDKGVHAGAGCGCVTGEDQSCSCVDPSGKPASVAVAAR